MTLFPYLQFNGECKAAMEFYRQCFGGQLDLMPVSDSPFAPQTPPEKVGHILHSTLDTGNFVFCGSDFEGLEPIRGGNNVRMMVNFSDEQELQDVFHSLSKGGRIKMEPHQTFWGATFAELEDPFGIHWKLNYARQHES